MSGEPTSRSDHLAAAAYRPRPLVIPAPVREGESLIGVIANATQANVLGRTSVILEDVGLRLFKPALVAQDGGGCVDLLALKLGCGTNDVRSRLHEYLPARSGELPSKKRNWCRPVRWGTGALERHNLELDARRISPTALASSNHHRAAWMCNLLPYCAETLEALVDRCGLCGERLGWRLARGIGTCEHCRKPVPASADEPLDPRWAEHYKGFAAMVSVAGTERAAVLERLAPALQALEPTGLVRLVVGLGRALDPSSDGYRHSAVVNPAARSIAIAVARGFEVIQDWPVRLRLRLEEITSSGASRVDRREMQSRIRRVGGYRVTQSEHDDLLRTAVPEMFEHLYRSMSFQEPVVLAAEAAKQIGIDLAELRMIEDARHITWTDTMAGIRLHRQYPASRVRAIAAEWRNSTRSAALGYRLGVPAYGIEQLTCLERLDRVTEPAVLAVDPQLRLTTDSADALLTCLDLAAKRESSPEGTVSLAALSRWSGGGMKPWGHALAELAEGGVECWRNPEITDPPPRGTTFANSTLVRLADVTRLFGTPFHEACHPAFPFASDICKDDAAEVLNADQTQLSPIIAAGALRFELGRRKGHWTSRAAVLALASTVITAAELAFMLNQNYSFTCRFMTRHPAVSRGCLGWRREDLLEHWWTLVDVLLADRAQPRRRRVLPAALPESHAELAYDRLKASLACIS